MSAVKSDGYWRCLYFVNHTSLEEHVHPAWVLKQNLDVFPRNTNNLCKNIQFTCLQLQLLFHFHTCYSGEGGFTHWPTHEQQPVNCICVKKVCVYMVRSPCSGSCSQPSPVGGAIVAPEVRPTQIGIKHLMIGWLGPHHNIEIIITGHLCFVNADDGASSSWWESSVENHVPHLRKVEKLAYWVIYINLWVSQVFNTAHKEFWPACHGSFKMFRRNLW